MIDKKDSIYSMCDPLTEIFRKKVADKRTSGA